MAKLQQILEQVYLRAIPGEPSAAISERCLLQAILRGASGRQVEALLLPGTGDWPELEGHRELRLRREAAKPQESVRTALDQVSAPFNTSFTPTGILERQLVKTAAPAVVIAAGPATLASADYLQLEHTRVLAFDQVTMPFPGMEQESADGLQALTDCGWRLRGFRDCAVAPTGNVVLAGAWFTMDDECWTGAEATSPSTSATVNRVSALRRVAHHAYELVARYRSTDERRQSLHRKLKKRLRQVRRERTMLSRQRTMLKRRIHQLISIAHKLRAQTRHAEFLAGLRAMQAAPFFHYGDPDPTLVLQHHMENSTAWPWLEQLAWKHWMRLGVLNQYEPRVLRVDQKAPAARRQEPLSISIVTPSFQQGPFLERTIRSVLEQSYPNLEYMVLDGGSSDGSREILENYAPRLAHWCSEPDGGQSSAIRTGLKQCNGEIMAWLNSDDCYLPGALDYVNAYFQTHPDVDVIYSHRIIIDERDREVGRWILPPHDDRVLLWADYVPQETMFWRRRIYEKVDGLDPAFQFAMDWDLLLRFQRAGARIVRVPKFLSTFRAHAEQKSAVLLHSQGEQEVRSLRQRELGTQFTRLQLQRITTWYQLRASTYARLWALGIRR